MFARAKIIWGEKWTRNFDDDSIQAALHEWSVAFFGRSKETIDKAMDFCKMNLEWPPSIAEFIGICEQASGMPSLEESFAAAIRRDFYHPVIQTVYDKVGSWAMRSDSEVTLRIKFKAAYQEAISSYRQQASQGQLTSRELTND